MKKLLLGVAVFALLGLPVLSAQELSDNPVPDFGIPLSDSELGQVSGGGPLLIAVGVFCVGALAGGGSYAVDKVISGGKVKTSGLVVSAAIGGVTTLASGGGSIGTAAIGLGGKALAARTIGAAIVSIGSGAAIAAADRADIENINGATRRVAVRAPNRRREYD
jgi:hypothetical protein